MLTSFSILAWKIPQTSLASYSTWDHQASDTTEHALSGQRGMPGRCHVKIGVIFPQVKEPLEARRDIEQTLPRAFRGSVPLPTT